MDDNKEKLLDIAKSIMNLSRNTLLVNLRFLDLALGQFRLIPADCGGLMTDGEHIVCDLRFVLKRYAKAQEVPVRDYLHMVIPACLCRAAQCCEAFKAEESLCCCPSWLFSCQRTQRALSIAL